jgi:hypothetical protein
VTRHLEPPSTPPMSSDTLQPETKTTCKTVVSAGEGEKGGVGGHSGGSFLLAGLFGYSPPASVEEVEPQAATGMQCDCGSTTLYGTSQGLRCSQCDCLVFRDDGTALTRVTWEGQDWQEADPDETPPCPCGERYCDTQVATGRWYCSRCFKADGSRTR